MAYLLNIEREKLQELKVLAAKEGTTIKNILDEGIDEYLKKHLKSNNPQTELSQFDKESILAIPNLYRDAKTWKKFYSLIKRKEDFKEVDKALNMILNIHNKEYKKF